MFKNAAPVSVVRHQRRVLPKPPLSKPICVHTFGMRRIEVHPARAQLSAVLRVAAEGRPVPPARHGEPAAAVEPWRHRLDDQRAALRNDRPDRPSAGDALDEGVSAPADRRG
ncbi:hypothetical protein SAMN06264365_12928 [Actinoplanes regularis]|uniref:Uncharacterized protein n=2 Tax=Actinoplanes regularis TaxID=52697 RepID=A0A239II54_9ACTN|nr:hypothetical protein Are01nite_80170 [Actinoplanes regularis]SNS93092.1 hypothetical protein SAMN06264365_12928 [Actinoplanes regularis]